MSSRYITVFKKEKSTIVARDATLDLSDESRRVLNGLLTRCPVTSRDKVEAMAGVEARLSRPTLGRLGGGVPQPPGPVVSTEYLAARRELPIWSHRQELVDAVQSKQVVLVTGRLANGFFE